MAKETGSAIASHITSGPTALSVMDALDAFGCPPGRGPLRVGPLAGHRGVRGRRARRRRAHRGRPGHRVSADAAERGAYVSLDGIGSGYWGDALGGYDVNLAWIDAARGGWLRGPDHHRGRHGLVRSRVIPRASRSKRSTASGRALATWPRTTARSPRSSCRPWRPPATRPSSSPSSCTGTPGRPSRAKAGTAYGAVAIRGASHAIAATALEGWAVRSFPDLSGTGPPRRRWQLVSVVG